MRDKPRTPEPQPPSDRSTDVKSAANISTVVVTVVVTVFSAIGGVIVSTLVVVALVTVFSAVGGVIVSGVVGVVGVVIVSGVVSSAAFITFIGNAVRGVSQLRLTLRHTGAAAPFAVAVWIGGRSRRWQAEDWQAALAESPRPTRYSLGLVSAATRMRLYDLGGALVKTACWVLATETRTWAPLTGLLLWGGVETTLDTGLGAAILTVIGAGAVFHTGVTLGRKQFGVEVRRREKTEQPDSPADP